MYISQGIDLTTLQSAAEVYNVTYIGSSEYTLQSASGAYLNINSDGSISYDSKAIPYNIYSVTYHS
jgi:phospholipase C